MKRIITIILLLCSILTNAQERTELIPFGDFDHWTVRYIKESSIIGGQTKAMYMIAPTDTIYGPKYTRGRSPWSSSNAYAKALGANKVSVSVTPERHGKGWCARLETRLEVVKAVGIDLKALATGSIYTGKLCDPVTLAHGKDPNSAIDMGMPFTKRPKALMLDYKAKINPNGQIVFANATSKVKNMPGQDYGQIVLVLQHRWEKNGHVYAYRVGTATEYIKQSTNGWVNNHRLEVSYGTSYNKGVKQWQQLNKDRFKTRNSKGQMVFIEEVGWRPDLAPTHLIIQISSGCQQPFTGCPGNVIWCDNIRLIYDSSSQSGDK